MKASLEPGQLTMKSTDVEFAKEAVDVRRVAYGGGVGVVDQDARGRRPGREAAPSRRRGKHGGETLKREKGALEKGGGDGEGDCPGDACGGKGGGGTDVDDEGGMVGEPGVELAGEDSEEGGGGALGCGGGHSSEEMEGKVTVALDYIYCTLTS